MYDYGKYLLKSTEESETVDTSDTEEEKWITDEELLMLPDDEFTCPFSGMRKGAALLACFTWGRKYP